MPYTKKILVILGQTATGKTKLAVDLAYKFNGEIVSADSRQVYKGMDIGTGKDLHDYKLKITNFKTKKIKNISIPYHLIDVVSPNTEFSLAKYQKLAYNAIDDILKRGKLPIIVGGSGLYLQAIVDGYKLSAKKPDKKLRKELEKKSVDELFNLLSKENVKFANNINKSDKKNKRRLIRYIETCNCDKRSLNIYEPKYESLIIGIKKDKEIIHKRIYKRLIKRLEKENMIDEVRQLRRKNITRKRLENFGLEYKYIALYLQKKIDYDEMVEKLFIAIRQFAKRQMTWFRRWEKQGAKINWISNRDEVEKVINKKM